MLEILVLSNYKLLNAKKAHSDKIMTIDISEQSNILFTGSYDTKIKLWKLPSLKIWKTFNEFPFQIISVTFKFRKLFSVTTSSQLHIYNIDDWTLTKSNIL